MRGMQSRTRRLCQILGIVIVLSALGGAAVVWYWVLATEINREERIWIGLLLTAVLWNRSWESLHEIFVLYMDYGEHCFTDFRVITVPVSFLILVLTGCAFFYWFLGLSLAKFFIYYAFVVSYLIPASAGMITEMVKRSVSRASL